MRTYAIGDIHGQLEMLQRCHALIAADRSKTGDSDAPVVHLGDYTDRGPRSAEVLDLLATGVQTGKPWICIKGNHDRMMSLYLRQRPERDHLLKAEYTWLHHKLGGADTLRSYGIDTDLPGDALHAQARQRVPGSHVRFLDDLPTSYETDHLFFCHAGIRPGVAFKDQTEDDLLWIRKPFHIDPSDHGKLIVHGHTPVEQATHYGNRVNLDTGAGYNRPMSVAVFEGRDAWLLTQTGRAPLRVDG